MIKIHFEIGQNVGLSIKENGQQVSETQSVFASDCLSDCLKEWKEKGYTEPEYFIDVWEQREGDVPYPIADIKLSGWVFNNE